jgi:hypothetical protein
MVLLPCRIAAMVARKASVSALIWLIALPLPLFQEIFTCFNRRRLSVPLPCSEHDGASFGRRASTAWNNVVLPQSHHPVAVADDVMLPWLAGAFVCRPASLQVCVSNSASADVLATSA